MLRLGYKASAEQFGPNELLDFSCAAEDAGFAAERCDRFNLNSLTILDCDGVGLLLKDVTRSRVAGCLIRDDRPGAKSLALRAEGGKSPVDRLRETYGAAAAEEIARHLPGT